MNTEICSTFEQTVNNTKHPFFRYTTMMNQEDIFKKIGQILNELNEQYQYLSQNPQELNELELELFLANASFLTDHVQIVKKLNANAPQKALPEHTEVHEEEIVVTAPVISQTEVADEPDVIPSIDDVRPVLEEEIFKPDNEPSTFEFILNERPSSDKFEFEEKSVDEIFDRPLSKEEEQIIAQKQKLREMDSLGLQLPEEDELGPEPFLIVTDPVEEAVNEGPEEISDEVKAEEPVRVTETITPTEPPLKTEQPVRTEGPAEEEKIPAEPIVQKELFKPVQPLTESVEPAAQTPVTEPPVTEPPFNHPVNQPAVKPTLNDILSGNTTVRNFNTENSRAAISDLKQAISLNDKMRYIKDLFNGYNLAYAEAIDLLNKMPDFKTADTFLQKNYAVKHNWAAKQETADQFYALLNQRFPSAK